MTTSPTTIRVDVEGARATVTLDRPDVLNAISPTMLEELVEAFERLALDTATRVVVLTGEGRAFSAGVDLKSLGGRSLEGGAVGGVLDQPARRLIEVIRTMDPIVVARVNGHCFTGALELALACDLVVVAEEATLADTHAKWGLRPTWGMSQRLPRAVGRQRARLLSYTGRSFTGAEAAAWGLAAVACPRAALDAVTDELVDELLANSRGSLAAYKDLFRTADERTLPAGLAYESRAEYVIEDTEDRIARFR